MTATLREHEPLTGGYPVPVNPTLKGIHVSNLSGTDPAVAALAAREDLAQYGQHARLLFVAELRLGIEDIDAFAADALTDGSDDKKCDLVHVSRGLGRVTLAQDYAVQNPIKGAQSSKSSDLNTAVSWLLASPEDQLPSPLRSAAIEARSAIIDGEIQQLHVWVVHNRPEAPDTDRELEQVRVTADALLKRHFPNANVEVVVDQIGVRTLSEDYRNRQLSILVSDQLSFETRGGFEVQTDSWRAYCTAVKASVLRTLWQQFGKRLLSPNIRDYLGVRRSEANINFGIKGTARDQPQNFMVFNNGITALVNSYELAEVQPGAPNLIVRGIGIVNGGQTTGALGTLPEDESQHLDQAWVQVRFIQSTNQQTVRDIVKYNNTQNRVEAADFRSNDAIQNRLRAEFSSIPEAEYRGGRRGGDVDPIKRERNLLADSTVVQALAAFHGDPNLGYNETREVWLNDSYYLKVFNQGVTARHIVFAYSLMKAIEETKIRLMKLPHQDRTQAQKDRLSFFSARGSIPLATWAVSDSLETLLGKVIPDPYALRFKDNVSPRRATEVWAPIVATALSFSAQLMPATDQGLKNKATVKAAVSAFGALLEATSGVNETIYAEFRHSTT